MKKELRQDDDVSASQYFRLQSACSVCLLCLPAFLPACHSSIHPSPSPSSLPAPCFVLPFSGYLSDTFILCQTKLSSAKQRLPEKWRAERGGGRGGHDETPCSLMHTCGLVLSPFYILDENMRKLSFACVYIENVLPHVVVSHTLSATPPPPPPPRKNELKSWLQKAAGNKALATRIICLSSASRK